MTLRLKVGQTKTLSEHHWVTRKSQRSYCYTVVNLVGGSIIRRASTLKDAVVRADALNDDITQQGRVI